MNKTKIIKSTFAAIPLLIAFLYGSGYIAQFVGNYKTWQLNGGSMGDGTSPPFPNPAIGECIRAVFSYPYGLIGFGICTGVIVVLVIMVMKMGAGERTDIDRERNYG